ncbi:hypothetical protein AJ78_08256 [Emergomyces pasteurianus Ep9510]|uniref:Uncharacterized protein n=1 Tax=Emergomyces pasteurianus Ep9510 TaxID=1447872 RepID=A0A1J9Q4J6_9EURO|nr:hypothetical protein AJ78_08256 [Emergomyces pasteurianus Ep9510]
MKTVTAHAATFSAVSAPSFFKSSEREFLRLLPFRQPAVAGRRSSEDRPREGFSFTPALKDSVTELSRRPSLPPLEDLFGSGWMAINSPARRNQSQGDLELGTQGPTIPTSPPAEAVAEGVEEDSPARRLAGTVICLHCVKQF